MFGLGRQGRGRTRDARTPGAREKAIGALTDAKGAVRESAVESAREGIAAVSEKIGRRAGSATAVAAAAAGGAVAAAVGYRPTPMILAGAAAATMALGNTVSSMVGKIISRTMHAGLNRLAPEQEGGGGATQIQALMGEISNVLQALDKVNQDVAQVVDTVNIAQTHVLTVSRGEGSNLINGAIRAYRQAAARLEEGVKEIAQADALMGKHLIVVAKGGT